MNAGPEQGVVGEISPTAFRKRVVYFVLESYLVRSNRASKINRGGVLSCVANGKHERPEENKQNATTFRRGAC